MLSRSWSAEASAPRYQEQGDKTTTLTRLWRIDVMTGHFQPLMITMFPARPVNDWQVVSCIIPPMLGSMQALSQNIDASARGLPRPIRAETSPHIFQSSKSIKRQLSDVQPLVAKRVQVVNESGSSVMRVADCASNKDVPLRLEPFNGERSLVIRFVQFGSCVPDPPRVGSTGAIVPHGLVGNFTAYAEEWQVETCYDVVIGGEICIIWKVINLKTGTSVERRETQREAKARQASGRTVTNQVFRQALDQRVSDLYQRLRCETNPTRISNIGSLITIMSPTRFTQGPLFFGLQHRCVQRAMINHLMNEKSQVNIK